MDVAAAPPSAAAAAAVEASGAGAGVANASEIHTNPRRGQKTCRETETSKEIHRKGEKENLRKHQRNSTEKAVFTLESS